jgi:hypothetical protein
MGKMLMRTMQVQVHEYRTNRYDQTGRREAGHHDSTECSSEANSEPESGCVPQGYGGIRRDTALYGEHGEHGEHGGHGKRRMGDRATG